MASVWARQGAISAKEPFRQLEFALIQLKCFAKAHNASTLAQVSQDHTKQY